MVLESPWKVLEFDFDKWARTLWFAQKKLVRFFWCIPGCLNPGVRVTLCSSGGPTFWSVLAVQEWVESRPGLSGDASTLALVDLVYETWISHWPAAGNSHGSRFLDWYLPEAEWCCLSEMVYCAWLHLVLCLCHPHLCTPPSQLASVYRRISK